MVPVASDLLRLSLAPASRLLYYKTWKKFSTYAFSLSTIPLPASPSLVVAFLVHLISSHSSPSPSSLLSTLSAIAYFHKLSSLPDPTSSFLVRKLVQGFSRSNPAADSRLPITPTVLRAIILATPRATSSSYESALFQAMFTLMFFALLRIGEVTPSPHNLNFNQVTISPTSVSITFTSFKHSKGLPFTLHLPSSPHLICPVKLLSQFLTFRSILPGPLFSYQDQTPVSVSRFRFVLKSVLTLSGHSHLRITPHSFRIGGATYAATLGLSPTHIKSIGRWSSSAADRYVRIQSFSLPSK